MHITVKREALVEEFGLLRRVAERKTTMPVLAFARLHAADDSVTITCTDLDTSLVTRTDATVQKPGTVLVPVKTLHGMARAGAGEDVALELFGSQVRFSCGGFSAKLQTLPVDDFPSIPPAPTAAAQIPAASLKTGLARVRFVADGADGKRDRAYGPAVFFEFEGERLALVATDGYRIALTSLTCPGGTFVGDTLVPKAPLQDLATLLDAADDEIVSFARDTNRLFFSVGDRVLVTSELNVRFPPYQRIVPKPNGRAVLFDRLALADCLKRVMQVSTLTAGRAEFDIAGAQITVKMRSSEIGTATEAVPVALLEGEPWPVIFSARYLLDFLQAAGTSQVQLAQSDPLQPGLFIAGDDYRYVLAPMQA